MTKWDTNIYALSGIRTHDTSVLAVKIHAVHVLPAYQEKIPARNAIYAHAQDFELLLVILKAFIPQPLNEQTKVFHVF
jgi:hypothetical protein